MNPRVFGELRKLASELEEYDEARNIIPRQ